MKYSPLGQPEEVTLTKKRKHLKIKVRKMISRNFSMILRSTYHAQAVIHRQCSSKISKPLSSEAVITKLDENSEAGFGSLADLGQVVNSRDTFLAPKKFKSVEELTDDDGESEHFEKISDTLRPYPKDYEKKIEDLLQKRRLVEALKVMDDEMKEECVKPNIETFKLLMQACSKVGNVKKTYDLLRRYLASGDEPTFGMYSNVFHACVNAPEETKKQSLKFAYATENNLMKKYQTSLPIPLYNTMIAAFSHCGDTERAFGILDEMKAKGVDVHLETLNHVLQACISDKDIGFRLAVSVYRKVLQKRHVKPNAITFNLLLRATRDCGVGSDEAVNDLLIEAMTSKQVRAFQQKLLDASDPKLLKSPNIEDVKENPEADPGMNRKVVIVEKDSEFIQKPQLPNLLAKRPNMDFISGLSPNFLKSSDGRLELFGGITGFLETMSKDFEAKIDAKTYSLLLACSRNCPENDELILSHMQSSNFRPDIDFFNQLIKHRSHRRDYEGAKKVLEIINLFDITPNIATYGCLSVCCKDNRSIFNLLKDMNAVKVRPNVLIITALIRSAREPLSVVKLLQATKSYGIIPDAKFVKQVDIFHKTYQSIIRKYEKDPNERIPYKVKQEIEKGYPNWKIFTDFYSNWLKETEVETPQHPWNQYKTRRDCRLKH